MNKQISKEGVTVVGQTSDNNSQQPLAEPQTVVDQTAPVIYYDDEPLSGEALAQAQLELDRALQLDCDMP